jgi:hypothetical protein
MSELDAAGLKELLKRLRSERSDFVKQSREAQKVRRADRRKVRKALEAGATTVPAVAAAADLPAETVLWHIASLRKYGAVVETEPEGSYPAYRLSGEGGQS